MPTQSLAGVIAAIRSSFTSLYAGQVGTDGTPVLVSDGNPGQDEPSAIVAVMDVNGPITRPTLGTNRSREIHAEVTVIISVYTPGDESAQPLSTDCALGLLTVLEQYLRTSPQERFGGACRDAWVSDIKMHPEVAVDATTGDPAGRVTTIETTMTAVVRY
jgi:hypothetical protein